MTMASRRTLHERFLTNIETTLAMKNGPEKKFKLIKMYGSVMRERGVELKTMSCEQIMDALREAVD